MANKYPYIGHSIDQTTMYNSNNQLVTPPHQNLAHCSDKTIKLYTILSNLKFPIIRLGVLLLFVASTTRYRVKNTLAENRYSVSRLIFLFIFVASSFFSLGQQYYYNLDWEDDCNGYYSYLPSCYESTGYRITKLNTTTDANGSAFFVIPDDMPNGCHIEVRLESSNLSRGTRNNSTYDYIRVYEATHDGNGNFTRGTRIDHTNNNSNNDRGWAPYRQNNQNRQPTTPDAVTTSAGVRAVWIEFTNGRTENNSAFEIWVYCTGCEPPHTPGNDINMDQDSRTINIDCGTYYWFYDSGGPDNNYGDNQDYTYTFTSTGQIYITFTDFRTQGNTRDHMTISDATSNTVFANQLSGDGTLTGRSYRTDAVGNSMRIVWHSNGNNNFRGWTALIWAEDCPATSCTTTPAFTNCPSSLMSGQTWNPISWNTTATPTGWTTSNATYSGGTVTAGATIGSASVSATVAESLPYCAGTMTCNFNVTCNNTNTLTVTSPIEVTVGGSSIDIDDYITANSSGGTPTFSTSSGNITLNTTTGVVTGVTAGDATVRVTVPQKTTGGITYCEKYVDVTIHVVEPGSDDCEGFETGTLHGWTSEGDKTWVAGAGDRTYNIAHTGSYNAEISSGSNGSGNSGYLVSPMMDFSGSNVVILSFWYINHDWSGDVDELGVYYRVNGGAWQGPLFSTATSHSEWTEASVVLPNLAANYQIGFKMTDNYGYAVGVDDICIVECTPSTATLEFSPDNGSINIGSTIDLRSPTLTNTTGQSVQWSTSSSAASFDTPGVVRGVLEDNVTITVTVPSWLDGSTLYCPMEATYTLEVIDPSTCEYTRQIAGDNASTTTNYDSPLNYYYGNNYCQMIYKHDEVCVSGGSNSTIHAIAFKYNSNSSADCKDDVYIYMGKTTKNEFDDVDDWITSGLTQVYHGALDYDGVPGWKWITLDDAYLYDGTDNLVITIMDVSGNWCADDILFYSTITTGENSVIYYYDDSSPITNTSNPEYDAYEIVMKRPNIKFCVNCCNLNATIDFGD